MNSRKGDGTMTTGNGAIPKQVDRDEVIRLATYHAAVYGWYDTSIEAQKSGALTISVMDMSPYEQLESGASHKFYVMMNASGFMVTRRATGEYEVKPHDQTEAQKQERELREAAMGMALWYVTGEGAGYLPDPRQGRDEQVEALRAAIAEVLEDEEPDEARYGGPLVHAVLTEIEPSLMLAPADEDSPAPVAVRQWLAIFGEYGRCEVGFFGYDVEDGQPFLAAVDADEEEYEEDEDEEDDLL
jgi:hypothetical protein